MTSLEIADRKASGWPRLEIRVGRKSLPAFRFFGYLGLVLSIGLTVALSARTGAPLWVMFVIILTGMLTFLTLAMVTKVITGEERLTYYHHEIAVVAVTILLCWALGQPVLRFLDITILGVGAFLVSGRIGCLMAGCCHGQPCAWGVRYRQEHADAGFTSYLVGVPLFPIQVLESAAVAALVLAGAWLVLTGRSQGGALGVYFAGYGIVRFGLEYLRGDPVRPYWLGFSEAQWTSAALMLLLVVLELTGMLPFSAWHVAAFGLVVAAMAATALRTQLGERDKARLFNPRHLQEVVSAAGFTFDRASTPRPGPDRPALTHLARTSEGIVISAGLTEDWRGEDGRAYQHYTISSERAELTEPDARRLALYIGRAAQLDGRFECIKGGRPGIYHLVWPVGGGLRPSVPGRGDLARAR
jgi:prolipoprotein diacylglyceryltransferase